VDSNVKRYPKNGIVISVCDLFEELMGAGEQAHVLEEGCGCRTSAREVPRQHGEE
jgi:hypothetical protein